MYVVSVAIMLVVYTKSKIKGLNVEYDVKGEKISVSHVSTGAGGKDEEPAQKVPLKLGLGDYITEIYCIFPFSC